MWGRKGAKVREEGVGREEKRWKERNANGGKGEGWNGKGDRKERHGKSGMRS